MHSAAALHSAQHAWESEARSRATTDVPLPGAGTASIIASVADASSTQPAASSASNGSFGVQRSGAPPPSTMRSVHWSASSSQLWRCSWW